MLPDLPFHLREQLTPKWLIGLDPRQFLGSMHSGKLEAEVGLFRDVNAWQNLRWWFTESELVYWGGFKKDNIPVMALAPDQLWEYDQRAPDYYHDRNRALPPEVVAVVNHAAAADKNPSK